MKKSLSTNVGTLKLQNPVMIASGVCGFGEENISVLNKCGAVVFKSITLEPREGNVTPRVVDTPSGMLNSIGLENPGIDGIKEKLKNISKLKCKKLASFLGFEEKEFYELIKKLEDYKVFDGYEVNLSCPNVKKGAWFYDLIILKKLLLKLRKLTKKPLIAKLSPETKVIEIATMCKNAGYDGVTLINTYTGLAVDYEKMCFSLGNKIGGLSGPCIKPLALRWVYEVKKIVGIDIVGCGGIVEGKDAVEHILVGASAIQIGCGYFRNPQLPIEVLSFIKNFLNKKKVLLKQVVGMIVNK